MQGRVWERFVEMPTVDRIFSGEEAMTAFTVGIPVYNEEAILVPNTERLIAFLDDLGREYEIIIGSNGSTDSTTALGFDLSRRFPCVNFFH